ncbi:hypothetical protein BH747_09930 [Enterococcus villorum]|uniref:Uncharacterized protein n=2 Tax=Enterococcus villorum TaxID=112904 RepID=A0A1V8YAE8_9ENTE|nr:hypothetical protein BH747_09930 [Enterococcus villorum]OQO72679.1 hypothetical protein BH744_11170 [Enterococcus villorum]
MTGIKVKAAENQSATFSVEALDKEGQSNSQGYYKFTGDPGETEHVKVKITNTSKEAIKVIAEVNPASTNSNGIPSYQNSAQLDETLKHPLNTLLDIQNNEINLEPNTFKILEGTLRYPEEEWDGQILGGIRFTEKIQENKNQTVNHQIAYTVGILVTMTDGKMPDNQLKMNDVIVDQRNYRNYIEANIQNVEPIIISNLEIAANIYKEKDKQSVYQYEASSMRMAPNSNFNFGIPTGNVPLQPGKYRLKLKVKADAKNYEFEKTFEITSNVAKKLNKSAVNLAEQKDYTIHLGMLLFLLLFLLVTKTLKRKEKITSQ